MVHGRCLVLGLIDSELTQEPLGTSALGRPRQRNIATPKDFGASVSIAMCPLVAFRNVHATQECCASVCGAGLSSGQF